MGTLRDCLGMGCCCSKDKGEPEKGDDSGDYIAKQNVTVWEYHDNVPEGKLVAGEARLELLEDEGTWWKMKCGNTTGYAAKYYFVHKEYDEDYKKEPWFFGDMSREEAEHLLGDNANPDGSFLVRHTTKQGGMDVLSLKYFDTQGEPGYKYKNYNVKRDGDQFFFTKKNRFAMLSQLIDFCMENKADGVITKLTNICLIPNPHSDDNFAFSMQDHDSLKVPYTEIVLGKELGSGQFGKVYEATFRGNLQVAVKQLKVEEGEEEGAKALEEFFSELNTLKKLNHPNLVQLFAYIVDRAKGNFMIQEFMKEGDLKNYLKKWKESPGKMKQIPKLWSKLLSWQIEVARGMERLESLNIVHRDLAARNVLLDQFLRAKVADFGLAVSSDERQQKGEKLPVKWTSPEALFKQKFTTMSDVWAYGILMFEILTIGEMPYRYSNVKNRECKEKLKAEFEKYNKTRQKDEWALRCKNPLLVNEYNLDIFPLLNVDKDGFKALFEVTKTCWDIEPRDRPTFRTIVRELESMRSYYDEA